MKFELLVGKFDKKLASIIKEDIRILTDIKKYVIASGGKRIRPLTHYLLVKLLGYKGNQWLDVGAVAELIHGASLLHDDVIDHAEVRRGQKTVGTLYGNKTAILAGDYLLACGVEHLSALGNPAILESFTATIRDLTVGELIQMEWEKNPDITLKTYHKIIYGKTASLFGSLTESAGILAGVSGQRLAEIRKFGVTLGILFQLKDDFIDYFSDDKKSGKTRFTDFRNGLFTWPAILLRDKLEKKELDAFKKMFQKEKKSKSDEKFLSELLNKYKIKEIMLSELGKEAGFLHKFLASFEDTKTASILSERIRKLEQEIIN